MSLDFQHSVIVGAPCARVFSYLAEFENNPKWQGGMVACRWSSETRLVTGSTYVQEAKFMGRKIETHFQVTAYTPGHSISIESTQSTFPIQVTRSAEAIDDERTKVIAHIRGQPTGLLKLFGGMVKKSVAKDYNKLKRILEADA